ncbi:major facilitator superfamily domain-containing protein 6-A-like [Gigantopelta aegis]|uniref:major facilitator superfamily domain-containing protein 6-A-like n=1 Tax=Gigantopelta aegis TaxID=1735272 RepID=UPI001B888F90|nr:major facilitator superfamily domain-containing protein 6-A-like [Gigantopelta aegis]
MATDFDQDEPVEKGYNQTQADRTMDDKEYQHTAKRLNNFPPAPVQRDLIDTIFTVVNRDLLVCKLFYFFFFGAFGSLFPLLAIYFKQLGLNASQAGVLMGFRPFIEFLGVPFWGGMADKWKRWKELLLFSLFSWIVFTLAIAFVQPPAHKCLHSNGTHTVLIAPYSHKIKRGTSPMEALAQQKIYFTPDDDVASMLESHGPTWGTEENDVGDCSSRCRRGTGRAPHSLDHTKIANANESDVIGLVHSPYSTVVYKEDAVQEAFFILLLLVVVGEFFSSPAITFADTVTLTILGDDTENYGRQRMFGSLGWGLAMFFVGMALDHSTTFPEHPCGVQHIAEKNYTVCFAVFTVLMSCAFITALQLRFPFQNKGPLQLTQITLRFKDVIKEKLTGVKKIDRTKLVEEEDDDNAFFSAEMEKQRRQEQETQLQQQQQQQQQQSTTTPAPLDDVEGHQYSYQGPDGPRSLKINPQQNKDMVTDALKAPGSYDYDYTGEAFMFKWMTVIRMLATYKYMSVLFIAWFMGFGIGVIFTFLFWHLQDLGGSPTLFGVASVINHISELLAYFFCSKFIAAWGKCSSCCCFSIDVISYKGDANLYKFEKR